MSNAKPPCKLPEVVWEDGRFRVQLDEGCSLSWWPEANGGWRVSMLSDRGLYFENAMRMH